jgi:hypothetical protein
MIATARKPRQQKSKPRSVRLGTAPWGNNPGHVTITAGKLVTDYFLWPLASQLGGTAFRLEKFTTQRDQEKDEPDHYDVLLAADGKHRCECRGHLRWQTACKHIDALLTLRAKGQL